MDSVIQIPDKPQRIENVEIKEIVNSSNHQSYSYILRNKNENIYLALNDTEYFIWNALDSHNSITEIYLKFYKEFGRLPLDYIKNFLDDLCRKGFIRNYDYDPSELKYRQKLLQLKLKIPFMGSVFDFLYKIFGKILFNNVAYSSIVIISVLGLFFFLRTPTQPLILKRNFLNFFLLYCSVFIPVFLHELSHALVCKHYGRNVKEAGFMLFMLLPVFYVDISDMWMADRKGRILSSIAGPLCDLFIGSFASIVYVIFPKLRFSIFLYQVASMAYIRILINLNPLMKWDGYYCLMDCLGIYNLKEKSLNFLRQSLFGKIRKKERFTLTEWKLLFYAMLSSIYTAYFLGFIMLKRIKKLIDIIRTQNIEAIDFGVVLTVLLLCLILAGLLKKLFTLSKKLIAYIQQRLFINHHADELVEDRS